MSPKHCDDYIDDATQPASLREFIRFHRMPAVERGKAWHKGELRIPTCYATMAKDVTWLDGHAEDPGGEYEVTIEAGTRVRLTMASRFGDVGITRTLSKDNGYETRVHIEDLKDFSRQAKQS